MSAFDLAATLLTLSALFGWVNHKALGLPHTVGLLVMGLLASLVLVGAELLTPGTGAAGELAEVVRKIDFSAVIMNGMLAFLVFAGALQVDLVELRARAWPVFALAVVGTIISTGIVGVALWTAAHALNHDLPLIWALVFGALISPTDPVAVLSTLKNVRVPAALEAEMKGEALFNDGVGIVLFVILSRIASGEHDVVPRDVLVLLAQETGGGLLLGLATGYLAFVGMRIIDDYPIEIIISLALVTATYAIAEKLHLSGPLAVVAAGVLIGNRGAQQAMTDRTRRYLFGLWHVIDEVLNSVLFLLIGLEVLLLRFETAELGIAATAVPIVLIARFVAVGAPLVFLPKGTVSARNVPFLTWAGVRGGISVALALSIPENPAKSLILSSTYGVVLFTILVQATTLGLIARRLYRPE